MFRIGYDNQADHILTKRSAWFIPVASLIIRTYIFNFVQAIAHNELLLATELIIALYVRDN